MSVLVIEQQPFAASLKKQIEAQGRSCQVATTARAGIQALKRNEKIKLVLLQLALPDQSGIEVCQHIWKHYRSTRPLIMMIIAQTDEESRIKGLEAGADDCLQRPFSNREFQARINALLRRSAFQETISIRSPHILIELSSRSVLIEHPKTHELDLIQDLSPCEFDLLRIFVENPGRVWEREQLVQSIWNRDSIDLRIIDTYISRLRRRIDPVDKFLFIKTEEKIGYVFRDDA